MAQYQFNATQFEPQYGGASGLPLGKHKVIISKTEFKPTKDTKGHYLEIELTAVEGTSQGSTQIDRLNLNNANAQTVQIASKQLAAYCAVMGRQGFNDTSELHNIPFVIEMRKQSGEAGEKGYTEVGALYDVNGNAPGKSGGATAAAAPVPTAAQPFVNAAGQVAQAPTASPSSAPWGGAATAPAAGGAPWQR